MAEVLRPAEVGPHECIWVDDKGRRWLVTATFARLGERIEVVGMEVRSVRKRGEARLAKYLPAAGSGAGIPMDSKVWRSTGTLTSEMRRHYLDDVLKGSGILTRPGNETAAAAWLAPKDRVKTRLAEVAAVYLAAIDAGQSTTLAVSKHFHLSPSAAAKRIQRARQIGLLPPARRGRRARRREIGNAAVSPD